MVETGLSYYSYSHLVITWLRHNAIPDNHRKFIRGSTEADQLRLKLHLLLLAGREKCLP